MYAYRTWIAPNHVTPVSIRGPSIFCSIFLVVSFLSISGGG